MDPMRFRIDRRVRGQGTVPFSRALLVRHMASQQTLLQEKTATVTLNFKFYKRVVCVCVCFAIAQLVRELSNRVRTSGTLQDCMFKSR